MLSLSWPPPDSFLRGVNNLLFWLSRYSQVSVHATGHYIKLIHAPLIQPYFFTASLTHISVRPLEFAPLHFCVLGHVFLPLTTHSEERFFLLTLAFPRLSHSANALKSHPLHEASSHKPTRIWISTAQMLSTTLHCTVVCSVILFTCVNTLEYIFFRDWTICKFIRIYVPERQNPVLPPNLFLTALFLQHHDATRVFKNTLTIRDS